MSGLWEISPIGKVLSPIKEPVKPDLFHNVRCTVEIYPEFKEGLLGLEEEIEVLVMFLFHLNIEKSPLLVHPRGDTSRPLRGVFATCSPTRPNSIGTNRCRLIALRNSYIDLIGLEAIDGTPVIDIKPFSCLDPRYDAKVEDLI
ncbi:tRNA-Thr(GGU) m(6)t(6)A37 methyltransferase TsaA [Acetomicrobium thermoterrenum DSM 13490]|uniref:tRNA-Thr(GGU) m(6)t(6)A37 methyltransferase TsaA n=1 Tax=Acetomicrobium thermoterrenum DSM 13490 TaxID=1120987 RepID=A0A1H3GEZ8_9BACT|nr:tRNA (N6-threonylcarbamoyladenosine(37)-N6)-methyltransferase TrmO [Acetomicrobium thermoterrenum]SDY01640.1 tRNA-Thr(GGU) m(6)t(6)A37 methyltransferase TsaA [Acetomicrobium thermoterrenum DSM 13490]